MGACCRIEPRPRLQDGMKQEWPPASPSSPGRTFAGAGATSNRSRSCPSAGSCPARQEDPRRAHGQDQHGHEPAGLQPDRSPPPLQAHPRRDPRGPLRAPRAAGGDRAPLGAQLPPESARPPEAPLPPRDFENGPGLPVPALFRPAGLLARFTLDVGGPVTACGREAIAVDDRDRLAMIWAGAGVLWVAAWAEVGATGGYQNAAWRTACPPRPIV